MCFVYRRKADYCVLCVLEKGRLLTEVCFVCSEERLTVVCFVFRRKADCCVLCVQKKGRMLTVAVSYTHLTLPTMAVV